MADSIPTALKQADISLWKCATKAAQLQTVKPIVAYWCSFCPLTCQMGHADIYRRILDR